MGHAQAKQTSQVQGLPSRSVDYLTEPGFTSATQCVCSGGKEPPPEEARKRVIADVANRFRDSERSYEDLGNAIHIYTD
eukprot:2177887-Lingulodinium_polyedra.AAC.1